jgi:hypothetical protein
VRDAPPDLLQAPVIVEIARRDGHCRVTALDRRDNTSLGLHRDVHADLYRRENQAGQRKAAKQPPRREYAEARSSALALDIVGLRTGGVPVIRFRDSANMIKAPVAMGVKIQA